jgi:uncharacterized protein with NAD-binding domain and iron-sulfur cluster
MGSRVLTGSRVESVVMENGRAAGVRLAGGGEVRADAVVLAVPWRQLPRLLPDALRTDPFFRAAEGLRASPIVGIHLWFDRPVFTGDFAAVLEAFPHWVFNKGRMRGHGAWDGKYLSIVQSGAAAECAMDREEILRRTLSDLRRLLPAAAGASLVHSRVIKEREATFVPAPGSDRHRPPQRTPVPGLFLAGAWTRTGWPATMEGAVRSGRLAARAVLGKVCWPITIMSCVS